MSPVFYLTVDFEKVVAPVWLKAKSMYQEENEAIEIASKHDNSAKTVRYAI